MVEARGVWEGGQACGKAEPCACMRPAQSTRSSPGCVPSSLCTSFACARLNINAIGAATFVHHLDDVPPRCVSPQLAQQQTAVALSRLGRENRQLHSLLQGAMRERLQGLEGGLREAGGQGEEQAGAGLGHTDVAY